MNISKFFKLSAVALAAIGVSGAALADTAETKGGLKIKTDDGRFEMSIGGRIQYDYYVVEGDDEATFGSGVTGNQSGGFFRRARLSFAGKLYGWEYLFVPDFSQNTGGIGLSPAGATCAGSGSGGVAGCGFGNTAGVNNGQTSASAGVAFQELYIATDLWGGKLFIGQFKPFRGIEELTSSNEITFLERPTTTASGIYANQFGQGIGYQKVFMDMINLAGNIYSPYRDGGIVNSGVAGGARVVFSPIHDEGAVLHVAGSMGYEQAANGLTTGVAYRYAGRRGGNTGTIVASGAGEGTMYAAGELAAVFGPLYFQGEYGHGDFGVSGGLAPLQANAFHAAASWFVTGETKPYDMKKGVFKSPKPINSWGAIELTTRYEYVEDEDVTMAAAVIQDANTFTAGMNYYFNPNFRLMFNYNQGNATTSDDRSDKPQSFAVRAHLYW